MLVTWVANLISGRALVKMSASMLPVGMYSNLTSLRATRSRAKWCMTSMCLDRLEMTGFLRILIAAWLSEKRPMVPVVTLSSERSVRNQRASLMADAAAMYSASVVERATVGCRREDQLTMPPLSINA